MEKRVIFFDIDGTLLDHNKKLPKSTLQAICDLKDAGHFVAIASGRAPFMFESLRKVLNIDSFVSINGQYVVLKGEAIYSNPIRLELLESLTQFSTENDHPLVYTDHETMKTNIENHIHVESGVGSLKLAYPEYEPQYYLDRDIYQCMLFCTENEEQEYRKQFPYLHFVRWHEFSMDVIPIGGSKANGIKRFIEKLGIPKEEVYAFGDYYNDLEMLQYVGNSVAMGNAPDLVKTAAKYVTKSVSEDGIQYGLKMLGLV